MVISATIVYRACIDYARCRTRFLLVPSHLINPFGLEVELIRCRRVKSREDRFDRFISGRTMAGAMPTISKTNRIRHASRSVRFLMRKSLRIRSGTKATMRLTDKFRAETPASSKTARTAQSVCITPIVTVYHCYRRHLSALRIAGFVKCVFGRIPNADFYISISVSRELALGSDIKTGGISAVYARFITGNQKAGYVHIGD